MNPGSVLEVQGVTVRFGGLTALDAVSLAVPPRHVLGVIGPNGPGKNTPLNVLCAFFRPDARDVPCRTSRVRSAKGGAAPPGRTPPRPRHGGIRGGGDTPNEPVVSRPPSLGARGLGEGSRDGPPERVAEQPRRDRRLPWHRRRR